MSNDQNGGMMGPAGAAPDGVTTTPGGTSIGNAPVASSGSMRDSLGAPGLTGRQMRDEGYLRRTTESDIAEVKLGQLALQKGGPDVKAFAQKMIDDHTAINGDIGNVADQLGVLVPKKMSKEDQEEYQKLSKLSGDAFDHAYVAYMVKAHREDLHQLRLEAMNTSNQSVQTELNKEVPVLREHMRLSIDLAQQEGVPIPARPQRPGAPAAAPQAPPPPQ